MKWFKPLAFVGFFVGLSVQVAATMPWPHEGSDIAPDPRITFGRLASGLRYAIMPNDNPKGTISLRLYVAAGSLNEGAEERGLAHFVEHLAFDGTTHYPSGKLVQFLQRQGMGFGPDVNAFTSYSNTIYKLELARNSPEDLREALQVLRDYAGGILFEPAAVERERGVILAEARVRDTEAARRDQAQTKAFYPDSLLPDRAPIGLPEIIRQATPAALQAFYHAWYQPERLTVVVVGDVTTGAVRQEIQELFDDLKSGAPPRADHPLSAVKPTEEAMVSIHLDPAEVGVRLGLGNIQTVEPRPFTTQEARTGLLLDVANHILADRTQRLVSKGDSPEGGFAVNTRLVERDYRVSHFGCGTSIGRWKAALRDLTVELRRARAQGFTAAEIDRQRVNLESYCRDTLATKDGRTSSALADEFTGTLAANRPAASPETWVSTIRAILPELTPEECQRALNQAWETGRQVLFVSSNNNLAATPAEVAEVHAEGLRIPLGAPEDQAAVGFGYTRFGPAGEVVQREHLQPAGLWEIVFRNGVRLHFKQTGFEPKTVQMQIRFGAGRLTEPADKPGLGVLTVGQFFGGLGQHTFDDLRLIMTGKQGDMNFSEDTGGFVFAAKTTTENALIYAQLLTAYIVDPGWREESRKQTDAQIATFYQRLWDGPQGVINELIRPQLTGGDVRIGLPRQDKLKSYPLAAYREWFQAQTKLAPMDLTMVGDLSVEEAVAIAAQTVGALPALQPAPDLGKYRQLAFPAKRFDFTWNVKDSGSKSGFVEFYWPLKKPVSGVEQVRLGLLMDILGDRLRVALREEMGQTYAPTAAVELFRDFRNYGWLTCQIEAAVPEVKRLQNAGSKQVKGLAGKGISQDELQRARQVRLANRERERQTNSYWLSVLDAAARYPEWVEIRDHEAEIISRTTVPDINALAREYFRADQESVFRIIPHETPGK